MQTVTINVNLPDEAAQTWAQLSDEDQAARLARVNEFAVSTLVSPEPTYHLLDEHEVEPTSEADALLVAEAYRAHKAGTNKGKSAAESYAIVARRLGFKSTTL